MAKYFVDKDLCIGCGFCVQTAPEVFRFDQNEKAEAYAQSDGQNAQDACDGCPVAAIEKIEN
jgi:ferredoxin